MEIRRSITSQGKKYLIPLLLILALIMVSSRKSIGAQSALPGLRINIGVRALGMGKAYVAVADDYSAPFWNPAGVGRLSLLEGGGGTMDKFGLDLNYTFLGGGGSYPVASVTTINGVSGGAGYLRFSKEVQRYDEDGNFLGNVNISREKYLGKVGLKLLKKGYIGGNIKIYHALDPERGVDGGNATADGLGYDLGVLFGPLQGLWLGASGFDISGTDLKWHNTPTEPIRKVQDQYFLGAAYAPQKLNFVLSGQYVQDSAGGNEFRIGGEYNLSFFNLIFSFRGGLVNPLEREAYFTAGGGIEIYQALRADIAWLQNKLIEAENTSDTIVLGAEFSF